MDEILLLKELVSIRSDPSRSNKDMITFLSGLFINYPQEIIEQDKKGLKLYNLIIKIPATIKVATDVRLRPIIFVMHSDTVEGEWFEDVVETDTRIIGLGSCDMKAGIASVCSAVLENSYDRDIFLTFSSDEETSGKGAKIINEKLDVEDALIIIPEPTSRKINNSQNSCISYEVTTVGQRQHASIDMNFNNTNSAILKMIKLCTFLADCFKIDSDISSQNIGRIHGGITPNIVADRCVMSFEQRFVPGVDIDKKKEDMVILLNKLGASDVKITFFGKDFNNNNKGLEKSITDMISKYFEPKFENLKAWTEAGIFSDRGECIIFGPGDVNFAHTKGEYVEKDDIKIFKNIYSEFIEKLN